MLTIATVNWRNYQDRGAEYVEALYDGISKHMPAGTEWKGVCLTDDPDSVPDGIWAKTLPLKIDGWWNKLALFREGSFPEGKRVVYFDLDTIIVGSLGDLCAYNGPFAAMKNPLMPGLASGVMAWEAGKADHIWTLWEKNGRPILPQGDQQWINYIEGMADRLQDKCPGQLVSFKLDCFPIGGVPDNARVVYFHGHPRPHQIDMPWITWKPGEDNACS